MAGRPNRGSRGKSEVTGRSADPNWGRRDAEPFTPKAGVPNYNAVKSGADSPKLVSDDAKRVLGELMEMLPYLHEADGMLLDALIKDKVMFDRYALYEEALVTEQAKNSKGETGIDAVPRNVIDRLGALSRNIQSGCRALGMTPTDRAALFKDQSWAKALQGRGSGPQLGEQGRMLRLQRGRAPDDDAGND